MRKAAAAHIGGYSAAIRQLPVPDVPWLEARRERCLWPVYEKDAP